MRDISPERIYRLLPGHHQADDHEQGHALRALAVLLAEELEIVEADIDALYENWFIETCEDWVIPYLGDLVGARPLAGAPMWPTPLRTASPRGPPPPWSSWPGMSPAGRPGRWNSSSA